MDREIARGSGIFPGVTFRVSTTRLYAEGVIDVSWRSHSGIVNPGHGSAATTVMKALGFFLRHTLSAEVTSGDDYGADSPYPTEPMRVSVIDLGPVTPPASATERPDGGT